MFDHSFICTFEGEISDIIIFIHIFFQHTNFTEQSTNFTEQSVARDVQNEVSNVCRKQLVKKKFFAHILQIQVVLTFMY